MWLEPRSCSSWTHHYGDDSALPIVFCFAPGNLILTTNQSIGLCRRRQWPEPHYEFYGSRAGFACVARVNNREYQTDTTYGSELLARENAAMRAYLICRNFSVNDGMYPSGHNKGAVLQGLPVAIGTERRSVYTEDLDTSTSSGSRSGGSSPRCYHSTKVYGDSRRSSTTGRGPRYGGRQY